MPADPNSKSSRNKQRPDHMRAGAEKGEGRDAAREWMRRMPPPALAKVSLYSWSRGMRLEQIGDDEDRLPRGKNDNFANGFLLAVRGKVNQILYSWQQTARGADLEREDQD